MGVDIHDVLTTIRKYGIFPENDIYTEEPPGQIFETVDLPGIGELREGETVYETTLDDITEESIDLEEETLAPPPLIDDERLHEWWDEVEDDIRGSDFPATQRRPRDGEDIPPPEPLCAWYCPIHFFGHGWGIYIREQCILNTAKEIIPFVNWYQVRHQGVPQRVIQLSLLRAGFYTMFLHEQFHHKVESFGFRLLVSMQQDKYRPYKNHVYRKTFGTSDCLEESLANADSYQRLKEPRYKSKLHPEIYEGVRRFLKATFPLQPPGYREATKYLSSPQFMQGSHKLKSMMTECAVTPRQAPEDWVIAPQGLRSLYNVDKQIYLVLPNKAKPLFNSRNISPGHTASTREMVKALVRHYGYAEVSGGKGSHVKLKNNSGQVVILPGNRQVLTPGAIKQILRDVGGNLPMSGLRDFLEGLTPVAFVQNLTPA